MNYSNLGYPGKKEYWKNCSENDERLKIKIENCAELLQTSITSYIARSKNIYISYQDCYDYIVQNGGFFVYDVIEGFINLKLSKEDLRPSYIEDQKTLLWLDSKNGCIENVLPCWPHDLSIVETFYSNEALSIWGHDIRIVKDHKQILLYEVYDELKKVFSDLKFKNSIEIMCYRES